MRQLLFFTLTATIFFVACNTTREVARRKQVVVEYDFQTHQYAAGRRFPWIHQPIAVHIKNINRLAYNITVSSRDSVIAENEADVTAPANDQTQMEKDVQDIKDKLATIAQVTNAVQASSKRPAENNGTAGSNSPKVQKAKDAEKFIALVSLHRITTKKMISNLPTLPVVPDTSAKDKAAAETYKKLQVLLTAQDDSLDYYKQILRDKNYSQSSTNETLSVAERMLEGDFNNVLTAYMGVQKVYQTYYNLKRIAALPCTDINTVSRDPILQSLLASSPLNKQHEVVENFKQISLAFLRNSDDYAQQYALMDGIDEDRKKVYLILQPLWQKEVQRLYDQVSKRNVYGLVDSSASLYQLLQSSCSFEFMSSTIQPAADIIVFDIDINGPKGAYFNGAAKFTYRDYVRGGLRYDISSGLVFNIGVADHQCHLEPIGDGDTSHIRIHENSRTNSYIPQLAVMFHASIRSKNMVNIGLTLGATINTTDLDIGSIFPGVSLMVGHRNKLVITTGPGLKKVDYLKGQYNTATPYVAGSIPLDALTEKVYRVGGFIGLGYNLTSKQKNLIKL